MVVGGRKSSDAQVSDLEVLTLISDNGHCNTLPKVDIEYNNIFGTLGLSETPVVCDVGPDADSSK